MRRILIAVPIVLALLLPTTAQASPDGVTVTNTATASGWGDVVPGDGEFSEFYLTGASVDPTDLGFTYRVIYVDGGGLDQHLAFQGTPDVSHFHQRRLLSARMRFQTDAAPICVEQPPDTTCEFGVLEVRVRWYDAYGHNHTVVDGDTETSWRRSAAVATLWWNGELLPGAKDMLGSGILYRTKVYS